MRDSRTLLSILLLMNTFIVAMIAFIAVILYNKDSEPVFFDINENGQIISPVPLDQLVISQGAINNWLNEAVLVAFNFNYSNHKNIPEKLKQFMSSRSIDSYLDFLNKEESFRDLEKNKVISSVIAKNAPVLNESSVLNGHFLETLSMDVELVVTNAQHRTTRLRKTISFLVLRVSELERPLGVIIYRFEINDTK